MNATHYAVWCQGFDNASILEMVRKPQELHLEIPSVWVDHQALLAFDEQLITKAKLFFGESVDAGDHPYMAHLELSGGFYVF